MDNTHRVGTRYATVFQTCSFFYFPIPLFSSHLISAMVDVESKNSTSSLTVSFIGLGAMGKVMAKRLVESKKFAKVIVYNRTAKVAEPLEALGAVVAKTPKEAAAGSDIILTCVADDKVRRVV